MMVLYWVRIDMALNFKLPKRDETCDHLLYVGRTADGWSLGRDHGQNSDPKFW